MTRCIVLLAGLLWSIPALASTDSQPSNTGSVTVEQADSSIEPDSSRGTLTASSDSDSTLDTSAVSAPDTPVAPPPAPSPAPLKDEIAKEKMPDINVTVTPSKGAIGDLIEWKVEAKKKSPDDRVVLPSSFDFGKLEIQSRSVSGETTDEKAMTQVAGIGLISFETGEFDIPPQKLTVVDGKGNLSEVMTPAFKVTINSLIANEPEPALKVDEKDGEVVMVDDYTLLYVAIALCAIVVVVLLTLLVRKLLSMRKPKPEPPPPPPRPAHEIAFEKLNALKHSGYLDEDMHKTFHLKLSEAFREYLGNRYHFDALECSTREIIDALRGMNLKLELQREVVQLLEDTDLVKFAKYVPAKDESLKLLDEAFHMVDITCVQVGPKISDEKVDSATPDAIDGGRK
ncbi:MAG: hypothetical protein JXR76_16380 [Deltaproteobacteria bacterium]|nr:hypothetical protein [Deltaproteobacteria bacterium]